MTLSDLATRAKDQFFTQVPEEVSLPNFAWEMQELGGLIPKLQHGMSTFDGARKTAAGGFLGYSFGTAPFIGDLEKLTTLLTVVDARIKQLKESYGKRTNLTAYFPNVVGIPAVRQLDYGGQAGSLWPVWLRFHRTDVRFHGHLYHELEGLDSVGGKVRALLAATGFANPLKVVWEAIPFSFFVDWFSGISSLLTDVRANPFQGRYEVSNLTYSVRSVSDFVIYQTNTMGLSNDILGAVGSVRFSRFVRYVGWPERFLGFNPEGLSPQQQLLYLALLAST
jgi:hypothetical protein